MRARKIFWAIASIVPAGVLASCGTPDIANLEPTSGPEHTVVAVDGDTFFATTYWDAGTSSETALAGPFLSARLFSVPESAPLGQHGVQLKRDAYAGNIATFTVTAGASDFPAPRVDRVGLAAADYHVDGNANKVDAWLYVQVANGDVGAEILVNGTVAGSAALQVMRNDLFGVSPADLAYPIHHYTSYFAALPDQPVGTTITVQARNTDAKTSTASSYVLPTSADTQDSDGDDLPDVWEKDGFDANGDGTIDFDLKALGANPLRPDVFVEVDIMQSLSNPPTTAVWTAFTNAFAAAPILNLDGGQGINVILDTSGSVPFSQTVDFDTSGGMPTTLFSTLKSNNFNNNVRGRIYHYGIWANMRPNGSSGRSDFGDDFIVSFDDFSAPYQAVRSQAETIMHEFGHDLGQRHGGSDDTNYNPIYSSIMNYSWQLRSGMSNALRQGSPIYAPFYYQQNGATEPNGALPANVGVAIDYSEGMGRALNEVSLDEPRGLYDNNAVDWNLDGDTTDTAVAGDANGDGDAVDMLSDFSNWSSLKFTGPRLNGTNTP